MIVVDLDPRRARRRTFRCSRAATVTVDEPPRRDLPPARRLGGDRCHVPAPGRPAAGRARRRPLRDVPAAQPPLRPAHRRSSRAGRTASPCTRSTSATATLWIAVVRDRRCHPLQRTREVRTGCPYCGTGCGLIAQVAGGRVTAVKGDPLHPVNHGATCRKPLRLPDALTAPDRATTPLWRDSLDARFRERSWRQTVGDLARRLQDVQQRHGPDAIALYISGQLLTEDYYVANEAGQGLPRHEQRRLQLAAVHVERGRRLHRRAGLRRPAAGLRRHRRRPTTS